MHDRIHNVILAFTVFKLLDNHAIHVILKRVIVLKRKKIKKLVTKKSRLRKE